MTTTASVLSAALAVLMAIIGVSNLFTLGPARNNAAHLEFSETAFRRIGACQLAATVGLAVGFPFSPLTSVTAVAIALLMVGAVHFHAKVGDPIGKKVPALGVGAAASALAVLAAFD